MYVKVEVWWTVEVVNHGGGGEQRRWGSEGGEGGEGGGGGEQSEVVVVKVEVLASEHCDCVIHSCNNNFFLLIQFVAIDILVLVL